MRGTPNHARQLTTPVVYALLHDKISNKIAMGVAGSEVEIHCALQLAIKAKSSNLNQLHLWKKDQQQTAQVQNKSSNESDQGYSTQA